MSASSIGPSNVMSIAQRAYNDVLESVFSFLPTFPARACCYRVCKAWKEACKTPYSSNVLDFALTSDGVLDWQRVWSYQKHLSRNKGSSREKEISKPTDSIERSSKKYAAIIQRAAAGVINVRFENHERAFPNACSEALRALITSIQIPPRFPRAVKLYLSLRLLPFSERLQRNLLYHFPMLRDLTLEDASGGVTANILGRPLPRELKTLTLNFTDSRVHVVKVAESCAGISEVHFNFVGSNDQQLQPLAQHFQGVHLCSITLRSSDGLLSDAGVAHLCQVHTVRRLSFSQLKYITDISLEAIAHLPLLESLTITDCAQVTHEGINALSMAPKLQSLSLVHLLYEEFPQFSQFPALQELNIHALKGRLNSEEIVSCRLLHTIKISIGVRFKHWSGGGYVSLSDNAIKYFKERMPQLRICRLSE